VNRCHPLLATTQFKPVEHVLTATYANRLHPKRFAFLSLCACESAHQVHRYQLSSSLFYTSTMAYQRKRSSRLQAATVAVVMALSAADVTAWSTNQKAFGSQRTHHPLSQPSHPVASPQSPVTTPKMLKNPGNPRVKNKSTRTENLKLSNSVLASCDTLPSFRTAHGLLSPETVLRLEERNGAGDHNEAIGRFLKTYRKSGPLSCVPMLSDPAILPHLTLAMREIAL
jgi:hypothetical protein